MITVEQWRSLLNVKREDFKHPEKLEFSIVRAYDRLIARLGVKPEVVSDWRLPDPTNPTSQHPLGRAIDFVVPGLDSLFVLSEIRDSKLFSGYGMYQNPLDAQSFHVDSRVTRTVDNPATWGGLITHPFDERTNSTVKRIEYVGLSTLVDMVKKNSLPVLALLLLTWFGWSLLRK